MSEYIDPQPYLVTLPSGRTIRSKDPHYADTCVWAPRTNPND